jgi:uncharacterized protein YjbJ (UPF0337 family)
MSIDKNKIVTQDELGEPAPIDQVEQRVEAEMKQLEGSAKKDVAEGLRNKKLAREGERLRKEGERELQQASQDDLERTVNQTSP